MSGIAEIVEAMLKSYNAPEDNPIRRPAGLLRLGAETALSAYPKPFQNTPESNQAALDAAMNFGPQGLLGMTKGALPKLARQAAKEAFETGKPASAVGFHGSPSPEVVFDPSRPAFLSSHPAVANEYTGHRGMWMSSPKEGATVYPSKVDFKNPLVVDAVGARHDNIPNPWVHWEPKVFGNLPKKALSVSDLADIARSQGHDGLIVKNVIDTADKDTRTKSTVYAALAPDVLKDFFSR